MFKKFLSFVVVSVFGFQTVFPPNLSAQTLAQLNLPQAGTMISTSNAFAPLMLRGITIDPKNPLQMDFIVNTGDTSLQGLLLEKEALQLARYFLAALTTPETELWVNLSPNEPERIIPKTLGETEMGRDMLAQDYVLKQLTSSLMFPESELGKKFWDKVYSDVQVRFGSVDIPVETFNKVWIVPKKAKVYEHNGSAFVVESKLKVMLEEDYLSQQTVGAGSKPALTQGRVTNPPLQNGTVQDIIRQIILPAIEEEVNHGEHFAKLRQIFNALILSAWYKQNLKNTLLSQIYVDQSKTDGVDVDDKTISQKIYNEYLQAFQKGAYDMIREDYDPVAHEIIARKYFSGGMDWTNMALLNVLSVVGSLVGDEVADFIGNPGRDFVMRTALNTSPVYSQESSLKGVALVILVFSCLLYVAKVFKKNNRAMLDVKAGSATRDLSKEEMESILTFLIKHRGHAASVMHGINGYAHIISADKEVFNIPQEVQYFEINGGGLLGFLKNAGLMLQLPGSRDNANTRLFHIPDGFDSPLKNLAKSEMTDARKYVLAGMVSQLSGLNLNAESVKTWRFWGGPEDSVHRPMAVKILGGFLKIINPGDLDVSITLETPTDSEHLEMIIKISSGEKVPSQTLQHIFDKLDVYLRAEYKKQIELVNRLDFIGLAPDETLTQNRGRYSSSLLSEISKTLQQFLNNRLFSPETNGLARNLKGRYGITAADIHRTNGDLAGHYSYEREHVRLYRFEFPLIPDGFQESAMFFKFSHSELYVDGRLAQWLDLRAPVWGSIYLAGQVVGMAAARKAAERGEDGKTVNEKGRAAALFFEQEALKRQGFKEGDIRDYLKAVRRGAPVFLISGGQLDQNVFQDVTRNLRRWGTFDDLFGRMNASHFDFSPYHSYTMSAEDAGKGFVRITVKDDLGDYVFSIDSGGAVKDGTFVYHAASPQEVTQIVHLSNSDKVFIGETIKRVFAKEVPEDAAAVNDAMLGSLTDEQMKQIVDAIDPEAKKAIKEKNNDRIFYVRFSDKGAVFQDKDGKDFLNLEGVSRKGVRFFLSAIIGRPGFENAKDHSGTWKYQFTQGNAREAYQELNRAMLATNIKEGRILLDSTRKIALSFNDIPERQLFHGEYDKLYPLTLQFFQLYGGEKPEYGIARKLAGELEKMQIVIDKTQDPYADVNLQNGKITINRDFLDFLFNTGRKKIYMSFIAGLLVEDPELRKQLEHLVVGQKRSLANDGESRLNDTKRLYALKQKVLANRLPENARNPYFLNDDDVTLLISDFLQRGKILDQRRLRDQLKEEYGWYGLKNISEGKAEGLLQAFFDKNSDIVEQRQERVKDNIDDLLKKLEEGAKVKGLDIGDASADQLINTYSLKRIYLEDPAYQGRVVVWDVEVERQDEVNFGGKTAHTGEMMYMPYAPTLANFASTGDTFQRVFKENNKDGYLAHLQQVLSGLRTYVKDNGRKLNVLPKDLREETNIQLKALRILVDDKEEKTVLSQIERTIKYIEEVAKDLREDGEYKTLNDYFKSVGARLDAKVRTLKAGEKKAEEDLKALRAEILKAKDNVVLSDEQKDELVNLYEQHAELLMQLNEFSMSLTELDGTFRKEEKQAIEETIKAIKKRKKALEQAIITKEVELYGDLYQRKKVEWINDFLKKVNRELQESYNDGAEKLLTAARLMIVPQDVKKAFKDNLVILAQRIGVPLNKLVLAIRSSAVGEDSETASFAGRQDTYLFVRAMPTKEDPDGLENIINNWIFNQSSLFNKRALEYRFDNDLPTYDEHVEISTLFQHMFLSERSSIAFSVVRNTGGFPAISWQVTEGQGDKLVSGEESGSEFIFTFDGDLLVRDKGDRRFKLVETDDGLGKRVLPLTAQEKSGFAMPDIVPLQEASRLIAYMHRFYGGNVDTENAFRRKRDAANQSKFLTDGQGQVLKDILGHRRFDWSFVFTQSRPETVESRKDKDVIPLKRIVITPEAFKKAQDQNFVLPYNFVAATGGTAQGAIAWVLSKDPETLSKTKDAIMATYQSDPDMNTAMVKARGIFAIRGGQNSHTMIVASEYGLVAITGIPDVTLEELQRALIEGTLVTIDAERKKIILGTDHELALEGKDFNIRKLPNIAPGDAKIGTITAAPVTAFKQWALRNYPDYPGIGLTRLELALVDKIGFNPMVLWAYENMKKKERDEPVDEGAPVLKRSMRFAPDNLRRYQNTKSYQEAQDVREKLEAERIKLEAGKAGWDEADKINWQLVKVRIAKKDKEMKELEQKGLLNLEKESEIYELLLRFDRLEDLKDGEEPTELTPDHKKDHELIEEIKDAYLIQKVEQAIGGYKSAQDFYVSVLSETIQAIGETLVPDKNEVVTVLQRISDPQLRLKVWDLVDQNYKIGLGHEEPLNELKGLLNELTGGDLKSIQKDTDADILWDVIGLLDKRMYIRTDDLKSDEYENMPGSEKFIKTEINPMMGWRGVGMLLDLPELYKEWHLAAIKKAVDTKRFKAAVFFPIVRRPIEVYKAYRMMREMGMEGQVQIGIMTELVTNAVNADEFTVVGLVEDDERFNNLVENPEALVQQLKDQRLIRKNGLMTKRFKDIVLKDRLDDFVIEGYTEDKRKEILGYLKSLIIFVDFTSTGGNDLRQGFGDDRNGGNPRLEALIGDSSVSVVRANALIFRGVRSTNERYGHKIEGAFCGNAPSVDKMYAKGLKYLGAKKVSVTIGPYANVTENLVNPDLRVPQVFQDAKTFELDVDPEAADHIQTFDQESSVDIDQFRFQLGDGKDVIHYQTLLEYDRMLARGKQNLTEKETIFRRHIKYRLTLMGYSNEKELDEPGMGMRAYREKFEAFLKNRVKSGQRFVVGTDRRVSHEYRALENGDRYEPVEANDQYGVYGMVKAMPGLISRAKILGMFAEKSSDPDMVQKSKAAGEMVWNLMIEKQWVLRINEEDYMVNMDAILDEKVLVHDAQASEQKIGDKIDLNKKTEDIKKYLERMKPDDYYFLKAELKVIGQLRQQGHDIVLQLNAVRDYKEIDQMNTVLEQLGITGLPLWVDAEFGGVVILNDLILDPRRGIQAVTISHPMQLVAKLFGNELDNPNGADITQDDIDFQLEVPLLVLATAAKKAGVPFYVSPEVDVESALAYTDAAMLEAAPIESTKHLFPDNTTAYVTLFSDNQIWVTYQDGEGYEDDVYPPHGLFTMQEVQEVLAASNNWQEFKQKVNFAMLESGGTGNVKKFRTASVSVKNLKVILAEETLASSTSYVVIGPDGTLLNSGAVEGDHNAAVAEALNLAKEPEKDNASLNRKGGIDLNPALFETFQVEKDDFGMLTEINGTPIAEIRSQIQGLTPFIIRITPLQDAAMLKLLGLADEPAGESEDAGMDADQKFLAAKES